MPEGGGRFHPIPHPCPGDLVRCYRSDRSDPSDRLSDGGWGKGPARIPHPMADHLFLLRLAGDFYTKARKTRVRFFRRLVANLEAALQGHHIPYRLEPTWSRLYLESPDPGAAEVAARVFGVQSVAEIARRPWTALEDLGATGVEFFGDAVRAKSFA